MLEYGAITSPKDKVEYSDDVAIASYSERSTHLWTCAGIFTIIFAFIVAGLVIVFRNRLGYTNLTMSAYWDSPGATSRVLFVGNSFTFYNGGLSNHFKAMAASSIPTRVVAADAVTKGGATLEIQWGLSRVHEAILSGHPQVPLQLYEFPPPALQYSHIVLQDDIPEYKTHNFDNFFKYTRLFTEQVKSVGAKPILFMAWPYARLNWVSLDEIVAAHKTISAELSVDVAPVGIALNRSLAARPSLAMLGGDHEHETLHGTYLAANVIYNTVFRENTTDFTAPYVPSGITAEEAKYLREIARDTVQAWIASNVA